MNITQRDTRKFRFITHCEKQAASKRYWVSPSSNLNPPKHIFDRNTNREVYAQNHPKTPRTEKQAVNNQRKIETRQTPEAKDLFMHRDHYLAQLPPVEPPPSHRIPIDVVLPRRAIRISSVTRMAQDRSLDVVNRLLVGGHTTTSTVDILHLV